MAAHNIEPADTPTYSSWLNAIEAVDIQKRDFLRTRVRPVVGIMKQSDEMKFVSERNDDVNNCRRIPFVHEYRIGVIGGLFDIQIVCVTAQLDPWHKHRNLGQRGCATFGKRVGPAPAIRGFIDVHLMSEPQQFPREAAQEMRVAVIPARDERVIEQDELHADASACAGLSFSGCAPALALRTAS